MRRWSTTQTKRNRPLRTTHLPSTTVTGLITRLQVLILAIESIPMRAQACFLVLAQSALAWCARADATAGPTTTPTPLPTITATLEPTINRTVYEKCRGLGTRRTRPLEKFLDWVCEKPMAAIGGNEDSNGANQCKQNKPFVLEANGWVRRAFDV